MSVLKPAWLFKAPMQRVICHWTAGGYEVSSTEKNFYHFLIGWDGSKAYVERGDCDIDDNLSTGDGIYAPHTGGLNTGSIGVSVCCMAGARQSPFYPGSYPMRKEQWELMAKVVAELVSFYGLPVDKQHVLQHGEVQSVYGINQDGKWDCLVLPWDVSKSPLRVAEDFRAVVRSFVTAQPVVQPVLHHAKLFFLKSKGVGRSFVDGKEASSAHVALEMNNGKISAAKVAGIALNPDLIESVTVDVVYREK